MTNELSTPKVSEPLQQVNATSAGLISGPSWNPSFGYDRKRQLEEEREKEIAAYKERQAAADPLQMRLLAMEMAIADLQKELKGLKNG